MTAKISARHRQAFIEALAETGNYAIAAAEVRVSRDWAFRLRRRDAEFDAACRAAVAQARERLSGASSPTPTSSHRFAARSSLSLEGNGAQCVVQRGNGRRVQVKRARPGQWTGETEQRFLAALMGSCNVSLAAAQVGKSAFAAYYHRRRDPGFSQRWDEAIRIGYAELEAVLIQNACHFLNPMDAPVPDQLLEGMSVSHAIDVARMNWGKVRRWREREE